MKYIVVWRDTPGQRVSTVVDADNDPVVRDADYVTTHNLSVIEDEDAVLTALDSFVGQKFAVPAGVARTALGWDV